MAGTALRGFATVNFWAENVAAARDWYVDLLGTQAYFERTGSDGRLVYAEFRAGDSEAEFGIIDQRFAPPNAAAGPGGAVMHDHDLAVAGG